MSPHAWGWTGEIDAILQTICVVPTRVGMDRPKGSYGLGYPRCPHTRGDGPFRVVCRPYSSKLSPHAWGWTVGIAVNTIKTTCCPHTRGDGPYSTPRSISSLMLSPHAWGWTGSRDVGHKPRTVVPTRVGMDRTARLRRLPARCCPHTRGDGPLCACLGCSLRLLSPHAWGWTVRMRAS